MGAVISDCGQYRYLLSRKIADEDDEAAQNPMLFIMLNPSTADAELDDPTIRRCKHFADREQASGLIVVNLFAYRETSPKKVKEAIEAGVDVVGPDNDAWIKQAIWWCSAMPIVAAWGSQSFSTHRASRVVGMLDEIWCLGKTKGGQPRHPLYIPNDQTLEPF